VDVFGIEHILAVEIDVFPFDGADMFQQAEVDVFAFNRKSHTCGNTLMWGRGVSSARQIAPRSLSSAAFSEGAKATAHLFIESGSPLPLCR
jgi:hypothetical protein